MISFNLYFGLADGPLKVKYQYTKKYKTEEDANKDLFKIAQNFYYKYEGSHHIPSYVDINKESEITGKSLESLYAEHTKDLVRFFCVPTEVDTISTRNLIYM